MLSKMLTGPAGSPTVDQISIQRMKVTRGRDIGSCTTAPVRRLQINTLNEHSRTQTGWNECSAAPRDLLVTLHDYLRFLERESEVKGYHIKGYRLRCAGLIYVACYRHSTHALYNIAASILANDLVPCIRMLSLLRLNCLCRITISLRYLPTSNTVL